MATFPVYRRYTSSVYEDKYFSEKNAAIPFKWESSPGRPKHDEDDCGGGEGGGGGGGGGGDGDDESVIIPAVPMYPLRPPPKLCPVSPMRVKDVLQEKNEDGVDDDDDELQQLAAHSMFDNDDEYFGSSPRLQAVRFRSFRASCVVPLCKNYMNKHALQQRSRSFSHAAIIKQHSGAASFRKGGMDSFASARRHSFAVPAGADVQVAAWAGAILAANSPSLEARLKLRDLLQQSGNFSEVLPTTINISNNGNLRKADDSRSLQLLCLAAPEADEELVMAAFLRKGGACTDHSAPCTEEDTTSLTQVAAVDRPKLKANGFSRKLKLFLRNECTACWCPSSTATSSY